MAKVKLLGVQELDFKSNDGKEIKGIKLHVSFPDEFVYGYKVDTKFISDDACHNLHIYPAELKDLCGSEINIETNFSGKLVGISVADKAV